MFFCYFAKGYNFCLFLFASLDEEILPTSDLHLKERVCSLNNFSFKNLLPLAREAKMKMAKLLFFQGKQLCQFNFASILHKGQLFKEISVRFEANSFFYVYRLLLGRFCWAGFVGQGSKQEVTKNVSLHKNCRKH